MANDGVAGIARNPIPLAHTLWNAFLIAMSTPSASVSQAAAHGSRIAPFASRMFLRDAHSPPSNYNVTSAIRASLSLITNRASFNRQPRRLEMLVTHRKHTPAALLNRQLSRTFVIAHASYTDRANMRENGRSRGCGRRILHFRARRTTRPGAPPDRRPVFG